MNTIKTGKKSLLLASIGMLACAVLVYTSCKKTSVTTTATTTKKATAPSTDDVAKQVAQNFYKALTGGYSGLNINDGINASLNIKTGNNTHMLNSTKNALCGYTIDTSYNAASKKGDTTFASSGSLQFTYTCSVNNVDGYKSSVTSNSHATDSATFNSTNSVTQSYVVVATDKTYKKLLMNGTINTTSNYGILGSHGYGSGFYYSSAQYVMTDVKVDVTSGVADAVSGSATFQMMLINEPPTTPQTDGVFFGYSGTINYLGNHMAKLGISTGYNQYKYYLVNMITGATTAM